jgi:hypothetical protein
VTQDTTTSRVSHLPAYLTWGASAAALGVGIGFGFAALENKHTLDDRCPNKVCGPELQELLNTSRMNATISTVAYGIGIGGVALGAVLFWLESRDSADTSTERASITNTGLSRSAVMPNRPSRPVHVGARGLTLSF